MEERVGESGYTFSAQVVASARVASAENHKLGMKVEVGNVVCFQVAENWTPVRGNQRQDKAGEAGRALIGNPMCRQVQNSVISHFRAQNSVDAGAESQKDRRFL